MTKEATNTTYEKVEDAWYTSWSMEASFTLKTKGGKRPSRASEVNGSVEVL